MNLKHACSIPTWHQNNSNWSSKTCICIKNGHIKLKKPGSLSLISKMTMILPCLIQYSNLTPIDITELLHGFKLTKTLMRLVATALSTYFWKINTYMAYLTPLSNALGTMHQTVYGHTPATKLKVKVNLLSQMLMSLMSKSKCHAHLILAQALEKSFTTHRQHAEISQEWVSLEKDNDLFGQLQRLLLFYANLFLYESS